MDEGVSRNRAFLSLWELCQGNLEGVGVLTGDTRGCVKEGSGTGISLFIGPPWGNWKWVPYRGL